MEGLKVKETKSRSIRKAISWRLVAFVNSWLVLSISITHSDVINALAMNVTGFILFYIFERVWNKINYGRYYEE